MGSATLVSTSRDERLTILMRELADFYLGYEVRRLRELREKLHGIITEALYGHKSGNGPVVMIDGRARQTVTLGRSFLEAVWGEHPDREVAFICYNPEIRDAVYAQSIQILDEVIETLKREGIAR